MPQAHAILGWALRWDDQGAAALAPIERAIELDRNRAEAYLWQSLVLSTANRGNAALAAIDNALRLDPLYGVTHIFALGRAHFALDAYDEALTHFDRGIERNPHFVPTHVFRLLTLQALGREEAIEPGIRALAAANPDYERSAAFRFYLRESSRRTTSR